MKKRDELFFLEPVKSRPGEIITGARGGSTHFHEYDEGLGIGHVKVNGDRERFSVNNFNREVDELLPAWMKREATPIIPEPIYKPEPIRPFIPDPEPWGPDMPFHGPEPYRPDIFFHGPEPYRPDLTNPFPGCQPSKSLFPEPEPFKPFIPDPPKYEPPRYEPPEPIIPKPAFRPIEERFPSLFPEKKSSLREFEIRPLKEPEFKSLIPDPPKYEPTFSKCELDMALFGPKPSRFEREEFRMPEPVYRPPEPMYTPPPLEPAPFHQPSHLAYDPCSLELRHQPLEFSNPCAPIWTSAQREAYGPVSSMTPAQEMAYGPPSQTCADSYGPGGGPTDAQIAMYGPFNK